MKFSHAIGYVMSRILLTILWIVGIGLYSIVLRIVGLFRRHKKGETEWHDIPAQTPGSLTTPY